MNKDQTIVLDYLIKIVTNKSVTEGTSFPFGAASILYIDDEDDDIPEIVSKAYQHLTIHDEYEVLYEFARLGINS